MRTTHFPHHNAPDHPRPHPKRNDPKAARGAHHYRRNLREYAERVPEEAIDWLLADLSTRGNIEYAQSWLIALGEIVPEEVHETIEEAFEQDARAWLDLFLLHGKFTTRDLHDVRTVIDRLENMYGETDDVISAKNALRRAEREAAKDIPPPPEAPPKVDKSVTTAIRELFSSLRET